MTREQSSPVSHEESLSSRRLQLNYSPEQLDKSNPQKAGACQPVESSDRSKPVFIAYLEKPGERREGRRGRDTFHKWNLHGDISRWGALLSWWDRWDFSPEIILEKQIFCWLLPLYFSFQRVNEMKWETSSLTLHFFTWNEDESEKTVVFQYRKI